jgi:hypothetical protein
MPSPPSPVSVSTAKIALAAMGNLTLTVGAPDFDQALADVLRARQELQAIIDSAGPPAS